MQLGPSYYPIQMLGGVNLHTHQSALGDSELVRSKNMAPISSRRMSKRLGVGYLGGLASSTDYPIAGIISPHINLDDIVALSRPATGTEDLNLISLRNGATSGSVSSALNWYSKRPWMFCGMQWIGSVLTQFVIVLAGPDAIPATTGGVSPPYPGQSLFPSGSSWATSNFSLSGTNNEYIRPKVASSYKRRTVYANFGAGYENTIVFTDNGYLSLVGDSVLAQNGRGVNLTIAQDGDEIVALVEVMLFNVGSPATSALLVLRRFGNPFLVTGELDQTTGGTSTLDIKRISVNAGCANPYTVARTPYGIIWAGQDDVWCFDYGTVRNIGLKIQPVLQVSPPEQQIWWSGAYHNGFYRLSVWGPDQDYAFPNAPGDQWWLRLDGGLPKSWQEAEWFGPHMIVNGALSNAVASKATRVMLPENRAGRGSKLYGIETGVVLDDETRNIVLIAYDQNKGRDLASNPAILGPASTSGCEIEGLIVSGELDPAPNYEKSADGLQGTIRADSDIQLTMAIIPDAGEDKQEVSKQIPAGGFRMGISNLDTDRIGQIRPSGFNIYATPGDRPIGMTFQYEIGDTAGYTVIEGVNDTLIVRFQEDPFLEANRYTWFATIDPGNYTRDELLTALTTAINAGKTGGPDWALAATSPVNFRADNNITDCIIAIIYNTQTQNGVTATEEQVLVCRRLGGMLGFIPNAANNAGVVGTLGPISVLTGTDSLYPNGISSYELWGLRANIEIFPREV